LAIIENGGVRARQQKGQRGEGRKTRQLSNAISALLTLAASGARTAVASPIVDSTQSASALAAGPASGGEAPIDLDQMQLEGTSVARQPAEEEGSVRLKGLLLFHVADGIGAGGQLRVGNVGVRASLAYQPQIFVIDEDPWDNKFAHFALRNTAQLNFDALYLFGQSEKGLSVGYRYSTLLGHGAGIGYQASINLYGQPFAFSVPVIYYPAASRRVEDKLKLTGDERINFPFGAGLEYGLGIAWLF
jgi:hypothetical protein